MQGRGLDTGDKVLAKAVTAQLIHALRMQASRGKIESVRPAKEGDLCPWVFLAWP